MSNVVRHPYHLVDESPWPVISASGAFFLTSGMVNWFFYKDMSLMLLGLALILMVMCQWWRDVSLEGAGQGRHSAVVELGLRWGMLLFIVSEVFFFLSFFWAFFHSSISPNMEVGSQWPPVGISPFNPFSVPLLNTVVLLSSGITVTWSHHSVMAGNHKEGVVGLGVTVLLGIYFTMLQGLEYYEACFSIADSSYGSSFFVATGFHGLHVLVGSTFLLVCAWRLSLSHFSSCHHFGFEAAAWYWHFVDVVWLFLFVSIYWWGGY